MRPVLRLGAYGNGNASKLIWTVNLLRHNSLRQNSSVQLQFMSCLKSMRSVLYTCTDQFSAPLLMLLRAWVARVRCDRRKMSPNNGFHWRARGVCSSRSPLRQQIVIINKTRNDCIVLVCFSLSLSLSLPTLILPSLFFLRYYGFFCLQHHLFSRLSLSSFTLRLLMEALGHLLVVTFYKGSFQLYSHWAIRLTCYITRDSLVGFALYQYNRKLTRHVDTAVLFP